MKPCRRRGDRAGMMRIDRLVAALVALFRRVLNVGRKRHAAECLKNVENGPLKAQRIEFAFAAEHFSLGSLLLCTLRLGTEINPGSGLRALARTKHGNGRIRSGNALDQSFYRAPGFLAAEETGLDDLCIVGDQKVARAQEVFNVAESLVFNHVFRNVKKARGRTVCERVLGDKLRRELKVEIRKMLFSHGLTGQ